MADVLADTVRLAARLHGDEAELREALRLLRRIELRLHDARREVTAVLFGPAPDTDL